MVAFPLDEDLAFNKAVAAEAAVCLSKGIPAANLDMSITKNTIGDSWELMVPGRIDGPAANLLEIEILAAIKAGAKEVFINLSQAEWMCSAAIRVILQYYRQMKNNGKVLLVTRPSPAILEILELTGFKDVIVEGGQSGRTR